MSNRNRFGSFLSGFMIGGLVSAVVTLLMAPRSGEEMRMELRARADLATRETGEVLRERAQEAVERHRDRMTADASGPTGPGEPPPI